MNNTEKIYLKKMREIEGEKKVEIAFELCKFVWKLAEENIKSKNLHISEKELKKELIKRIYDRY